MKKYTDILRHDIKNILRCPACHADNSLIILNDASISCSSCDTLYAMNELKQCCALLHSGSGSETKQNIQSWWGDLYQQLYADNDAKLTTQEYARQLDLLEDFFKKSDHLAVNEMPIKSLRGKKVLEIGSGSGAHSALFKKNGADIVSVDITPERAMATALKLSIVTEGCGRAYQADAEELPFRDEVFDIVYSNGVLHHSEDTNACISEVYRVLKPGGIAVLMLYSRHSANVWFNIFPRGIISRYIFRFPQAEWMGLVTEGKPSHGTIKNPITRVYSAREIRSLLRDFEMEGMRKVGWEWDQFAIPRLTQFRRVVMKILGFSMHDGGIPVAGQPRMPPCLLERWISRYVGFAWDIKVRKRESA